MANDLDMRIRISADLTELLARLNQLNGNLRGVGENANRAAQQTAQIGNSFTRLRNIIVGLSGAYIGLSAAQNFLSGLVSTVGQVQNLNSRLLTLTGGAQQLAETNSYLAETSDRLSASQMALGDSYAQLLVLQNSGLLSVNDSRAILEGFANLSARVGASADQLKQAMYGLSQGLGSGTLRAEELNQITEPLPGLLQALGDAAGTTAGGFRKMVNDGQVSSEMLRGTLLNALEQYQGAAAATAGNVVPSFTRLQNAWLRFQATFSAPVQEFITPVLGKAIEIVNRLTDYIIANQAEITAFASNAGQALASAMEYGAQLAVHLKDIVSTVAELVADNPELAIMALGFLGMSKAASALGNSAGEAQGGMSSFLVTLLDAPGKIEGLLTSIGNLPGAFGTAREGLRDLTAFFPRLLVQAQVAASAFGGLTTVLLKLGGVLTVTFLSLSKVIELYQVMRGASEANAEAQNRLASGFSEVKQRGENARDAIANLGNMDNTGLETLRQDLVGRLSMLDGILMEMNATMSDGGKVDMQAYQEATSLAKIYRDQLGEVKTRLAEVREAKIEVKPEIKPLLDSEKDVEAFFQRVRAMGEQRIDLDLSNIQTELDSLAATLGTDTTANAQRVAQAYRDAAGQILTLEQARTQQEIDIAERIYADKAARVRANVTDETQAATELRGLTDQLMQSRIAATQGYYQAVQQQLDKARGEWQKYADQVRTLDKSIAEEQIRQGEVVRDIERQGMSASQVYYDRKRELAELSAQAESALADGNLKQAEEIARKREGLARELMQAAKESGVSDYGAQQEGLAEVQASHELINRSLEAQKQLAVENKAAQTAQIDALTASLSNVAGELTALQEKQLDLSLKVTAPELDAELDAVQKRIQDRDLQVSMKINPQAYDGTNINEYISGLNFDAKNILFNPEIRAVETAISNLATIPSEHEVRFKANTLDLKAALEALQRTSSTGDAASGYATGGHVRGPGGPTTDSIWARLSNGEFVQPFRAVQHYGVGFMEAVRTLRLPKFAAGGLVRMPEISLPRINYATGGAVSGGGMPQVVRLELNLGGKRLPPLHAPSDEVGRLVNALRGLA